LVMKHAPNFTPKNVKLGVLFLFIVFIVIFEQKSIENV